MPEPVRHDACEGLCSTLQVLELVGLAVPFIGIGQGCLAASDAFPLAALRKLSVDFDEFLLVGRHVFLGEDGFGGAFGHADGAIDALIRVDDEEVGAFLEAIDRAHVHAIGVLAFDTVFSDDVCHGDALFWCVEGTWG